MTTAVVEPDLERGADTPPPVQSRRETALRLGALVVGTALVTAAIDALGGWPWVVVVWSVIVIIMLHELGHFVTAKWSGMKATEFFVGLGPRLWSIKRGETEYGVKAFPLGGYVRILGMTSLEELDPSDEPRSYVNQSTSKRVLVASAGSIVHVLLAISLAFFALWLTGESVTGRFLEVTPLTKTSPAYLGGLRNGDQILSMNGRAIRTETALIAAIQSSHGHAVPVVILRHHQRLVLSVTPARTPTCTNGLCIGVDSGYPVSLRPVGWLGAAGAAGTLVGQVAGATVDAFGNAFSPGGIDSLAHQVTSPKAAQRARASGTSTVSMLGAFELLAFAAKAGARPLLGMLISLNISLAVLNMLPMLPLDGGHVAIALYERARSRRGRARYRADVTKLMPAVYAFMAFLILFVAGKLYLDIAHGVSNPFH